MAKKGNGSGQLNSWVKIETIKLVDKMIEEQKKKTGFELSRSQIVEVAIEKMAREMGVK